MFGSYPKVIFPKLLSFPERSVRRVGAQTLKFLSLATWHRETKNVPHQQTTDWIHTLNAISFRVEPHQLFWSPLLPLPLLHSVCPQPGLVTATEHTNTLLSYSPSPLTRDLCRPFAISSCSSLKSNGVCLLLGKFCDLLQTFFSQSHIFSCCISSVSLGGWIWGVMGSP